MHKLWGWQGSPRMALLLSWAQGSCPEASVAAAPSRRSADRGSLAPGDLDVMLEQGSWELDRHEVFPQTPSTSIPKIFFLQACQIFSRKITPMAMPEPAEQRAASTSQPKLTAGLPAWVFPPHRTSQKGLFRLFAGEESLPRQVRVSGLHQLCVP